MPAFTYRDSEARKGYEEPGDHHVTVESFEWKISGAGNDVLSLKLRTDGGALVFDNLVFTDKAFWKIDHALKCFLPSKGKKMPAKDDDFDMNNDWVEENLKDAHGWVTLSKGTSPNGKVRNEVEQYLPWDPSRKSAVPTKPPVQATTKPTPATTSAKPTKLADDDEIPF